MASVTINSSSYNGKSITIINGKVIIDGKDVTPESKEINITVTGNIDNLEVGYSNKLEIIGNVGKVQSGSGNVNCKDVLGDIQTGSGDVDCESIGGNVRTGSGNVSTTTIAGSVNTGSGNIKYKK